MKPKPMKHSRMSAPPPKPRAAHYTPEGRAAISAAQKRRWARYRKAKKAEAKALAAKQAARAAKRKAA